MTTKTMKALKQALNLAGMVICIMFLVSAFLVMYMFDRDGKLLGDG